MFSVRPYYAQFDPFADTKRALHVSNLSSYTSFDSCQTKVPKPESLAETCQQHYSQTFGRFISSTPITQTIDANDAYLIESDQFHRHFKPLSLPALLIPLNFHTGSPKLDQYHPFISCEVPSSTLKPSQKLFLKDVENPVLNQPLPKCSVCSVQLEYPFLSSTTNYLCSTCFLSFPLPPYSSSFDYFLIQEPKKIFDGNWTLGEVNSLLKLFEELGDNWCEISRKLTNRTPQECFLQFLRIPMYDFYYTDDPISVPEYPLPDKPPLIPFMCAPQPIAALVEFLRVLDEELGFAVGEQAQNFIESNFATSTTNISIKQVYEVMKNLLFFTGQFARGRAEIEYKNMIEEIQKINRFIADLRDKTFTKVLNDASK